MVCFVTAMSTWSDFHRNNWILILNHHLCGYFWETLNTFRIQTKHLNINMTQLCFCSCFKANQAWSVREHFPQPPWTQHAQPDLDNPTWLLHQVSFLLNAQRMKTRHKLVTHVLLYCILTPVLCRNDAPAVTLEVLKSLASVRRFDMAVMFMSSPEKKRKSLWRLTVYFTFFNHTCHHIDKCCTIFLSSSCERTVWLPPPSRAGSVICHSLTEEVRSLTFGLEFYRLPVSAHNAALLSEPMEKRSYIPILNTFTFIYTLIESDCCATSIHPWKCDFMFFSLFITLHLFWVGSWKFTDCLDCRCRVLFPVQQVMSSLIQM